MNFIQSTCQRASRQNSKKKSLHFMSNQKPIALVTISNENKFELGKDAVAMLKKLKGNIGVVAIAGLYRTGKSYLLNRLLGRQSGFDVGNSVNACTKVFQFNFFFQPFSPVQIPILTIPSNQGYLYMGSSVRNNQRE